MDALLHFCIIVSHLILFLFVIKNWAVAEKCCQLVLNPNLILTIYLKKNMQVLDKIVLVPQRQ